ncbi:efflux transporter outer membrane subunit, partial [Salidesulfovibrio brasiliensis]|uniref:efflux transporter outer membrane subunit n=1 Tax=Salidesulfovibrio brasiliensis TaxID=221711 RepID=UPI0006D281A6
RASAVQAGAGLYPTLDATGGYTHTRQGTEAQGGGRSMTVTEDHSLGLSAGYEVDLWNRIGSAAKSGALKAEAGREDVNAAAMTVAGEVAAKWVEIQAQRRKKAILQEQIKVNRTYLELIELRFRNALATALDVYQQRENVARVKAELPPVESEERILLHELALLLGRPAGSLDIEDAGLPELNDLPGAGLPSDLLANRPDVRSAGLKLRAADWSVAEARANRLPSLTLTGQGAYSGAQLTNLFDNWLLSLAGSVMGPILDGGYREAAVEKARGEADEQLADYKSAVYTAFKEVEDALARERWQKKYLQAHETQLQAARTSLDEAISRYRQGLDDYLPVLSALMTVQDLELALVEDHKNLILYRIALHRALGGGWTNELQPPQAEELAATPQPTEG